MAEFIIYETNECFKVLPSDKENDERKWGECDISYSYVTNDKGIISIRFYKLYNTTDEKYKFSFFLKGEFHHKFSFGKVFNLDWEISDKNSKVILQVKGGDFTNQWGLQSIARGLQNFLNQLYQFNSIEDFKRYQEIKDEDSWKDKDLKDKILLLAEVIKLYDKYSKVNPSSYCLRELDNDIKKKLKGLLKDLN